MKIILLLLVCLLGICLRCALAAGTVPLLPPTYTASPSPVDAATSTQSTFQTTTTTTSATSSSPSTVGATTKTVNFIRMKNVQKDGQSLGDCLARLSLLKKGTSSSGVAGTVASKSVQDIFDSFNTQTSGSISEFDKVITEMTTTTGGQNCRYQSMNYSHATNSFLNLDTAYNTLYPGSVLQSKYIDGVQLGVQSQMPVPISTSMKNANIKVLLHNNGQTYTVPYNADINPAINQIIASSLTNLSSLPVYFQMGTSDDMAFFANKMGFNTNIQKKLGIYYTKSSTFTTYKKKIIFSFFKLISNFEVSIDSASNPINTFFSSLLTVDEVVKRNNTWWGVGYPPIYIDSITYGSALLLTVDYTNVTGPLYESINGNTAMGPAQMQIILNKIIVNPTLKVLSLGPFSAAELSAIKTGKWTDYLLAVPNTPTSQMTNPLIYTVKNFKQGKYNSTVNIEYYKINCGALATPATVAGTVYSAADASFASSPQNPIPVNAGLTHSASYSIGSSGNTAVKTSTSTTSGSSSSGQQSGSSLDYAIRYTQSFGTETFNQPNILLLLSDILPYAPVNLYISQTNGTLIDKKTIKESAAVIGLDQYFTDSQIVVEIRHTAGKKSSTSTLQGQVNISFILNGLELPKGTSKCTGTLCANKAAIFKVNQQIPVVLP